MNPEGALTSPKAEVQGRPIDSNPPFPGLGLDPDDLPPVLSDLQRLAEVQARKKP
jgi:hypothetical protein